MSHEIDMSNNRANVAYAGEAPWHGLGSILLPTDTREEALAKAGLNFDVMSSPVMFSPAVQDGANTPRFPITYQDRVVLYRSDTLAPLSVVSANRYNVIQPGSIFDFIWDVCTQAGFPLDVAGSLLGGQKVWALAKVNEGENIIGHDRVRPYLLAATSYDGSMSTTFKFSAIRVVCNNTITMAAGGAYVEGAGTGQTEKDKTEGPVVQCVRIPHSATPNYDEIKKQLGLVFNAWDRFLVEARLMAGQKVSTGFAKLFLASLLAKDMDSIESRKEAEESRAFQRLMALVTTPGAMPNVPGVEGTAWNLLNAVTYNVDHERGREGTRLNSAWFGAGEGLKNKAKELLLEVL